MLCLGAASSLAGQGPIIFQDQDPPMARSHSCLGLMILHDEATSIAVSNDIGSSMREAVEGRSSSMERA